VLIFGPEIWCFFLTDGYAWWCSIVLDWVQGVFLYGCVWVHCWKEGLYFLDFWLCLVDTGVEPGVFSTPAILPDDDPVLFFSMVLPASDWWLGWWLFSLGNCFPAQGAYFLGTGVVFQVCSWGWFCQEFGSGFYWTDWWRGPDFVSFLSLFPIVFCFSFVVFVWQLLCIFRSNLVCKSYCIAQIVWPFFNQVEAYVYVKTSSVV